MDFNLSKEQELLRDGLGRFLSTRYDLKKSRAAAKTGAGWQPDIWRGFADELGILGAALPEEAPIFLYHGNKDQTAPFGHVDLYAKGIPQARRCRYPARSSWASDAAALYVSGTDAASYDPMWVRGTLFG